MYIHVHVQVTPVRLMRPGNGRDASCAMCDWLISTCTHVGLMILRTCALQIHVAGPSKIICMYIRTHADW